MQPEMIRKNHMDVEWHEYTDENGQNTPVINASITEKASIIGRVGIMFLSCGTGAWRVRSSMNALAEAMGITCTADIGLMSIEYTCFDGENGFTQSLCLTNTGVNTSKLNRLEHFIRNFETEGKNMSGEAPTILVGEFFSAVRSVSGQTGAKGGSILAKEGGLNPGRLPSLQSRRSPRQSRIRTPWRRCAVRLRTAPGRHPAPV